MTAVTTNRGESAPLRVTILFASIVFASSVLRADDIGSTDLSRFFFLYVSTLFITVSWLSIFLTLRFGTKVHESHLLQNGWFVLAGISMLLLALVSGMQIWTVNNLGFEFDYREESWDAAFGLFKFPLGCIGAGLAAMGFVATIHRSAQTAKQIKLAEENAELAEVSNNFSNYFKHKEEFEKLLDSLKLSPSLSTASVYERFYPKSEMTKPVFNLSDCLQQNFYGMQQAYSGTRFDFASPPESVRQADDCYRQAVDLITLSYAYMGIIPPESYINLKRNAVTEISSSHTVELGFFYYFHQRHELNKLDDEIKRLAHSLLTLSSISSESGTFLTEVSAFYSAWQCQINVARETGANN